MGHGQAVTMSVLESNYPSLYGRLPTIPETVQVFFWTSTAVFTLIPAVIPPAHADGRDKTVAKILDPDGKIIGSMGPIVQDAASTGTGTWEFIVVGSRRNPFSDPVLLVLQIEWREEVAYRINCGEIGEEAWENALYKWKLIVLK